MKYTWAFLFLGIGSGVFAQDNPAVEKIQPQETDSLYSRDVPPDIQPEFPGGAATFYKFIANNFRAPDQEGLDGRIVAEFIVEKDGSLTNIKVLQDMGYGTAEEILRVLGMSPKWTPGVIHDKPVRVKYTIPIKIKT
jgi:hypothetical protein